jgi:hypothetical protein
VAAPNAPARCAGTTRSRDRPRSCSRYDGALDDVLKLTNVARPSMVFRRGDHLVRDLRAQRLAGVSSDVREGINALIRRYSPRFPGPPSSTKSRGFHTTAIRSLVTAIITPRAAPTPQPRLFGRTRGDVVGVQAHRGRSLRQRVWCTSSTRCGSCREMAPERSAMLARAGAMRFVRLRELASARTSSACSAHDRQLCRTACSLRETLRGGASQTCERTALSATCRGPRALLALGASSEPRHGRTTVALFQVLTGQLPFAAADAIGWAHAHVSKHAPSRTGR